MVEIIINNIIKEIEQDTKFNDLLEVSYNSTSDSDMSKPFYAPFEDWRKSHVKTFVKTSVVGIENNEELEMEVSDGIIEMTFNINSENIKDMSYMVYRCFRDKYKKEFECYNKEM